MLYLDASALVKRYVAEDGSDAIREAMQDAEWSSCRVCFLETVRAVGMAAGKKGVTRVERDWPSFDVVEVDRTLTERAAPLALSHGLRCLDALHLAAALSLPARDLTFATWDVRLHGAARSEGLAAFPAELG